MVGGGDPFLHEIFGQQAPLERNRRCENCQRQICKAFIGLTIRTKMIGGGDPFI